MRASNDNQYTPTALAALPLFASDKEIAAAIVGRASAASWITDVMPELERRGFPAKDYLHGGRAVPLVIKFYDEYFGMTKGIAMAKPGGEEKIWKPKKERAA